MTWVGRWIALCLLSACGQLGWLADDVCQPGLCPTGMRCDTKSGRCVAELPEAAGRPAFHGPFSVVVASSSDQAENASPQPNVDKTWWLGFVPARQSLVAWDGEVLRYLHGPASEDGGLPSGQASAMARDPLGGVIAVWLRQADGSVWCARSRHNWRVHQVWAGGVEAPIALATGPSTAWLAVRDPIARTVLVAWQDHPAESERDPRPWTTSLLTAPTGMGDAPGQALDLGQALALVATASGPVVAAYEAIGGDLVLATQDGGTWQAARVAGRDRTTGQDTTDAGNGLAMTVAPGGDLLVAYRDKTQSSVYLLRDRSGVTSASLVGTGLQVDGATQTQRATLYGGRLALAALADGRAVVASHDATRWQVDVAVQKPTGDFTHTWLTAAQAGGPLAWPALQVLGTAQVFVHAIRTSALDGPLANRVETMEVPAQSGGASAQAKRGAP
jgi:hypothetical protein